MIPEVAKVVWKPCYRLIPSHFPPVGIYDRVANPADLAAVFAVENLTNPRLRQEAGAISLVPPQVVIHRSGNDIVLNWASTGAPYYKVYTAATPQGPFTTLLGTTSGTAFTDVNPLGTLVKFYQVTASATP